MWVALRDLKECEKPMREEQTTKRLNGDFTEEEWLEFRESAFTKAVERAMLRTFKKANSVAKYQMYEYEIYTQDKPEKCLRKAHKHLTAALGPEPFDNKTNPVDGGEPLHEHHSLVAMCRLFIAIGHSEMMALGLSEADKEESIDE